MTTIRKNDAFLLQEDENKTRILRLEDGKKTNWNTGIQACIELNKLKTMRESEFYQYCKSLIFN